MYYVCYTGRSSATETYACFFTHYTAIIMFSSNQAAARREVEGSEAMREQQRGSWGRREGVDKGRGKAEWWRGMGE